MRVSRPVRNVMRRGLWPAALAALALMFQALVPGFAMAYEASHGGLRVEVCTAEGLKTITVGGKPAPAKSGFMGLHCSACVAASFAAVPAPDTLLTEAIRYTAQAVAFTPERTHTPAQARAPPRPPGQGPPANPNA